MTADTVDQIVRGLGHDMRDLVCMVPDGLWFVAVDVPWSRPGPTGNALNRLAERGILKRRSDQFARRSEYHFLPLGLQVRERLQKGEGL